MTRVILETVQLEVLACGNCGVPFAMSTDFILERQKTHANWYCPNGHARHYVGETEAEKFRRLYEAAEARAGRNYDRAEATERSLRTTKGHVTRLRKEVLAGKCPFCGQHLRDLERHISRQHKDEPPEMPA